MKRFFAKTAAAVLVAMCTTVAAAGSSQALTRQEALEKYNASRPVKSEDNKLGLTIEKIDKEKGHSFFVKWNSTSEIIMKNPRNQQFTLVLLYFIDADDPSNFKMGLASQFKGDIGNMTNMVVTLDKPAKAVIIYFKGIDKSIPNSEAFLTVPLVFMAEIGDAPKLLDAEPRYAGEFFKSVYAQVEKIEKERADKAKAEKDKAGQTAKPVKKTK